MRPWVTRAAAAVVAISMVGIAAFVVVRKRADREALDTESRVVRALEAHVRSGYAVREARGWERPVVRGTPESKNAADAQRGALASLTSADAATLDALSRSIRDGSPLTTAATALVRDNAEALAGLRRATQGDHSFTHVAFERATTDGTYQGDVGRRRLLAGRLLLGHAMQESAPECVAIGVDVVRMAQDTMPGSLLVTAVIADTLADIAAPLLLRCGDRIDDAEVRAEAVRQLRVVALHPPSFGDILDDEWIFMSYGMLESARASSAAGMRVRRIAWDAVDQFVAHPPDYSEVDAAHYPSAFQRVADHGNRWEGSGNPLLSIARMELLKYVVRDARAQASLRALVVALEAQGERSLGPKTRAALETPGLRDPFNGQRFRAEERAGGLAIVSSGVAANAPEEAVADTSEVRFDVRFAPPPPP